MRLYHADQESNLGAAAISKTPSLLAHFEALEDPRVDRTKKHLLIDLITIAICATIACADGWDEIFDFAQAKAGWLRQFIGLANGIPSADTLRRVISRLEPEAFQSCFLSWVHSVFVVSKGDIVAIDGKMLNGSGTAKTSALHLVSAWRSGLEGVCLGQVAAEDHSNEITAIPQLLKVLSIKGCLVTIDAIGCQRDIIAQIALENEADYVIAVKANQPELYQSVKEFLDEHVPEFQIPHDSHEQVDVGHCRTEHRRYTITSEIEWLPSQFQWARLKSVGVVDSWRLVDGKESKERRYYVTSVAPNAERFANAVRQHWSIENKLHWMLDVTFGEDDVAIRDTRAAANLAIVRKLSLGLLERIKTKKDSIPRMRKRSAWDDAFLLKVLQGS